MDLIPSKKNENAHIKRLNKFGKCSTTDELPGTFMTGFEQQEEHTKSKPVFTNIETSLVPHGFEERTEASLEDMLSNLHDYENKMEATEEMYTKLKSNMQLNKNNMNRGRQSMTDLRNGVKGLSNVMNIDMRDNQVNE